MEILKRTLVGTEMELKSPVIQREKTYKRMNLAEDRMSELTDKIEDLDKIS